MTLNAHSPMVEAPFAPVAGDPAVLQTQGRYAVKLEIFEGPLDLLLHLIKLNEVQITDIPIAMIADQYVGYLGQIKNLDIDIAGEYLVMAATLAWIKSRILLPPDSDEESEEEDPRAALIARLLEYQRFKEVAQDLGGRQRLGRDVFEAHTPDPEPIPSESREIVVDVLQLVEAFKQVLQQTRHLGLAHELAAETVTVRERMIVLMERLQQLDSVEFSELFHYEGLETPSRTIIIATFLAVLELVRLSAARAYQGLNEMGTPVGPIRLRQAEGMNTEAWNERVSDLM